MDLITRLLAEQHFYANYLKNKGFSGKVNNLVANSQMIITP
ncbi:hypothetical protein [Streptococcus ovuberis]|nr:hypothetical protein [Streptococcus ovuberis]